MERKRGLSADCADGADLINHEKHEEHERQLRCEKEKMGSIYPQMTQMTQIFKKEEGSPAEGGYLINNE